MKLSRFLILFVGVFATFPGFCVTATEPQSDLACATCSESAAAVPDSPDKRLSKEQAAAEIQSRFKAHVANIRKTRKSEWENKIIKLGDLEMKYEVRTFGKKPTNGHSLFISMHGGGNAPARVNERQWKNQIRLYKPSEGIYLVPRAPTDDWNLWHQPHIDKFFTRIIENAIAFEGIDSNRVYIMGYSAGGDGVYQLAPRMADQLAAAAMMAGHPNNASPLGLRNIGFTLHMGGKDSAYDRNNIAAQWKEKLAALQKDDPDGYRHDVVIHPDHGHWMNRDDAVAVPWMAKFVRDVHPQKIVWYQSGVTHDRFYWLAAEEKDQQPGAKMIVSRKGNTFTIHETEKVDHVIIRLNDLMVDFDKPILVKRIAQDSIVTRFENVARNAKTIAATLQDRGDINSIYTAEIKVKVE